MMEKQLYNRTFAGLKAQHAALTYEVIDDIIRGSGIKRIVELGTAAGALSFYFGLVGKMLDIPVYTVDASLPSDDARRTMRDLGVFYFKLNVMEPDGITSINSLISDEPVQYPSRLLCLIFFSVKFRRRVNGF